MDLNDREPMFASIKSVSGLVSPRAVVERLDEAWYRGVSKRGRWMDLIGDYAGSERFVLDGESLLQHVLDDPLLALAREAEPSFQILHALHSTEGFLDELIKRAALFDIVFWADTRHLTIKTGADAFVTASRTLARTLILNHLQRHAEKFGIAVFHFQSPMFVMANDGGILGEDSTLETAQAVLVQRTFIFDLLTQGVAVSLLNGMEFRDSKMFSFVFEQWFDPNARKKLPSKIWTISGSALDALNQHKSLCGDDAPRSANVSTANLDDILADFAASLSQPDQTPLFDELLYLFLVHCLLLPSLTVEERGRPLQELDTSLSHSLLDTFLPTAFLGLSSAVSKTNAYIDVDGRVFVTLLHFIIKQAPGRIQDVVPPAILTRLSSIWSKSNRRPVNLLQLRRYQPLPERTSSVTSTQAKEEDPSFALLPFHNEVFDSELASVHVAVADDADDLLPAELEFSQGTAFSDTKHWHAHRRTILPKHLGGEAPKPQDARQRMRALRRDQFAMASMQRLAATLTGASGALLEPMVIGAVGTRSNRAVKEKPAQQHSKKKAAPLSKADKIRLENAKSRQDKEDEASAEWWQGHLAAMENGNMDRTRKQRYLENLFRSKKSDRGWLAVEMQLYSLDMKIREWIADAAQDNPSVHDGYALSIMRTAKDMYDKSAMPSAALEILDAILTCLGFAGYIPSFHAAVPDRTIIDRPLSFKFVKLLKSKSKQSRHQFMHIAEHPARWQMRLFGEYMDRSMDSQYDTRVNFLPDAWQREVLDSLDADKSVLVVAPTSAGKTFISFYAMEKVLRGSDDGILVYVAPTKALVNQVAAEVYARFRKEMPGKNCWAVHTRDFKVHDPQNCQILITVPEMLAIMLLSPVYARVWTPRIKRIILDEIHTIGQHEGGSVWEQIILLSPCPIIGLSATIGEPEAFNTWLQSVQDAKGIPHKFIQHPHRYSHLRKFFYLPRPQDEKFAFDGLDSYEPGANMRFIHPVSTLSFGASVLPPDLAMEPLDLLRLYEALVSLKPGLDVDLESLDPAKFFPNDRLLKQKDILRYEAAMKAMLAKLIATSDATDPSSPVQRVIAEVQDPVLAKLDANALNMPPKRASFLRGILPLLADLNASGNLPALLFNFDRSDCEVMAKQIYHSLKNAEAKWRSNSTQWTNKLNQWEKWKSEEKQRQRATERLSKQKIDPDAPRETDSHSWESSFDPKDPSPQFSFAQLHAYTKEDLMDEIQSLRRWSSTQDWVLDALWRGVGIHHAGMNKAYRSLVERLFRLGFLRVVIATGTLALGINAPTKTTVFCGGSPYLTALTYRQCSGRAGRRGYDLLGRVVFYGLSMDRVQRLILSRLPRLTGTFPLSSTLCLRLFSLLHGSDNSPFAQNAIKSILRLPQVSFGSDVGREQLLHHLRFSVEYLRRARLLDGEGKPINLFGVAAHLYFTEPSNLALVMLLQSGALHAICAQASTIDARRDFILLMCHLFGRRYLPKAYTTSENLQELVRKSPSIVVLPEMQPMARTLLAQHRNEILQIFTAYALTFARQHAGEFGPDNRLPLSGEMSTSSEERDSSPLRTYLADTAIRPAVRSAFVANSGLGDTFESVQELARTVRRGVYLNEHAIPSIDRIVPRTGDAAQAFELNAYLLDFYMHGQVAALAAANGIRRGDVWYALQDFYLSLMSLRGDLEQLIMKMSKNAAAQADVGIDDDAVDSGYQSGDSTDESMQDNEALGQDAGITRPSRVPDRDWAVYEVVNGAVNEFGEKFKAMWA
ncbi:P-loop containing nucleoside triphosphate hydrolase protein [Dentipellis sp. KUC8613]|nr:P-loop containing nucleoside triphosphate hydrolase protein [Dentipellis sp. KUC8613]